MMLRPRTITSAEDGLERPAMIQCGFAATTGANDRHEFGICIGKGSINKRL
jgi:hypothetical protein